MSRQSLEAVEEAMLAVLRHLLADPTSNRLYGSGKVPALFASNTAASRRLVERLVERGYLVLDSFDDGQATCQITDKGRQWLLDKENVRLLLEDLLRATESQREELAELKEMWNRQCARMEAQSSSIAEVIQRLADAADDFSLEPFIEDFLSTFEQAGGSAACSIVELFQSARSRRPNLTIGQFHDAIRSLQSSGRIRLSPWTGPLYQLPDHEIALLIGHEVLHYVYRVRSFAA